MLADAIAVIADPLVRNLATVCGNVAHADPANDHPAVMLAYRAEVVAEGPNGRRTIPIDDFFVDTFVTALEPDEVLVELRIPAPTPAAAARTRSWSAKSATMRSPGWRCNCRLNAAGEVTQAGIGLTNVGPMPIRAVDAENALVGGVPDDEAIRRAADLAAAATDPVDDLRGPAEYKRAVTRTLTARALRTALARAGREPELERTNDERRRMRWTPYP